MIRFVNAKLNLGLDIVRRRPDGYHDLETIFYPIGMHNGTPVNPEPFCDILEITPAPETQFVMSGRHVDCPLEKNLVYKAWKVFKQSYESRTRSLIPHFRIELEKHLPDGAGLGGGSADAGFTLRLLNDMTGNLFTKRELADMALRLGADCPFFIYDRPCFASGVGEVMSDIDLDLGGWWCLLVKPDLSISTREAFAGITPGDPDISLKTLVSLPVAQWQGKMKNDFEASLFPNYPVLPEIKSRMMASGAEYAAMSGSGSTIFGLFASEEAALLASDDFRHNFGSDIYVSLCLL